MKYLIWILFFICFWACITKKTVDATNKNLIQPKKVIGQYAFVWSGTNVMLNFPTVALELYEDSSFMLVGTLNPKQANEYGGIGCFTGNFTHENNKLLLILLFRQVSHYKLNSYHSGVGLPNTDRSDIMNFLDVDSLNRVIFYKDQTTSPTKIHFAMTHGRYYMNGCEDTAQIYHPFYMDEAYFLPKPFFDAKTCPDTSFIRKIKAYHREYYKDSFAHKSPRSK